MFWRCFVRMCNTVANLDDKMITPRRSASPFSSWCNSPLTYSLLLGEQREANKQQTVPSSPSLSPLFARRLNRVGGSTTAGHVLPAKTGSSRSLNRYSPGPAIVPDGNDNISSNSPLQRQVLAAVGCKRQRGASSPCGNSLATPSPIATNSKRFCSSSSGVCEERSSDENHVVVLNRTKPAHTRTTKSSLSQEQVVPICGYLSPSYDGETKINQKRDLSTSKDGIKLLELFTGDDIFASHED